MFVLSLALLGCTPGGGEAASPAADPAARDVSLGAFRPWAESKSPAETSTEALEDLYALGLYDLVQERLEAQLRSRPKDAGGWALRLRCLEALERPRERLAALEEMARSFPERGGELALERMRILIDLWDLAGCRELLVEQKAPTGPVADLARSIAPLFDPRPVYQEDFREPLDEAWRISCPLELSRDAGELRLRYHQFLAARAGRLLDWDGAWLQARWEFAVSRLDWAQGLFIGIFQQDGTGRLGLHCGAGGAYGGPNAVLRRSLSLFAALDGSTANGGEAGGPSGLEIDQRYAVRLDYLAAQRRVHVVIRPLPGPGRDIVLDARDVPAFPAGRYAFGLSHERGQGKEDFMVEARLDAIRLACAAPQGSVPGPAAGDGHDDHEQQAARAWVDGDPERALEHYQRVVRSGSVALDAAVFRIFACQLAKQPEAMKSALIATLKADRPGTAERLLVYRSLLPPPPPEILGYYRELAAYYQGPAFPLDRARQAAGRGEIDEGYAHLAEAFKRSEQVRELLQAAESDDALAPLRADPRWAKLRERFAGDQEGEGR